MWPAVTSGWVSALSERVCVKSADQVRRFVCAANQVERTALVSAAGTDPQTARSNTSGNLNLNLSHNLNLTGCRLRLRLGLRSRPAIAATLAQNDTIARYAGELPART